jgi:hypothetical protein
VALVRKFARTIDLVPIEVKDKINRTRSQDKITMYREHDRGRGRQDARSGEHRAVSVCARFAWDPTYEMNGPRSPGQVIAWVSGFQGSIPAAHATFASLRKPN